MSQEIARVQEHVLLELFKRLTRAGFRVQLCNVVYDGYYPIGQTFDDCEHQFYLVLYQPTLPGLMRAMRITTMLLAEELEDAGVMGR